jgi:cytochrome c-type biogenesis protein CcmE
MKAGTKFLIGALVIMAGVAGLIISGVKETGVYFLTPSELVA